jgi:hypothetical protein
MDWSAFSVMFVVLIRKSSEMDLGSIRYEVPVPMPEPLEQGLQLVERPHHLAIVEFWYRNTIFDY